MNKHKKTSDSKTHQSETKQWLNNLRKQSYLKECFCKNENCCSQIISAHSIQNNKILKHISYNGNVISFSNPSFDADYDSIEFSTPQTGRKKATTFTGFCKYHDNEIFKPIELHDYQKGNIEQEFLFAYRALAKEYHEKKTQQLMITKSIEQSGLGNFDNPNPFERLILETKTTIQQMEKDRIFFNEMLKKKDFKHLKTQCIVFHKEYHLAVSSCFAPERDVKGGIINTYSNLEKDLKYIYLTIFPQNGKTFVLFTFFKKNNKQLSPLISQINQSSIQNKQKIISNMLAIYCENIVLSPSRYEKLSESQKSIFLETFSETLLTEDGTISDRLSQPKNFNLFI